MRPIKYRAWDKEHKVMVPVADMEWSVNGNLGSVNGYPDWDLIPIQFTGLLDRNGQEIYEGDILKNLYPSEFPCEKCGHISIDTRIYVVKWYEDYGGFIAGSGDPEYEEFDYLLVSDWGTAEVIGNIFANPKLEVVN